MLLVASMALALRQLAAVQARGRSVREVLRATLAMEVDVGSGTQNAQTIAALLAAIEVKDEDTTRHNLRVAELAVAIGREMRLAGPILRVLARSGLLHDVGKVAIPDAVLGKPGPLNDEEWGLVRKHPGIGVAILGPSGQAAPGGGDRARPPRAHGRGRLPEGPAGRPDPAGGPHHRSRRHLRRAGHRPAISEGVPAG